MATPPLITRSKGNTATPPVPPHTFNANDELLTIKQVCQLMNISRSTFYAIKEHLMCINIQGAVRISKQSVINYINSQI